MVKKRKYESFPTFPKGKERSAIAFWLGIVYNNIDFVKLKAELIS